MIVFILIVIIDEPIHLLLILDSPCAFAFLLFIRICP